MRYLSESFAVGALRRSASIEQFLGPAFRGERQGIRWVTIEPRRTGRDRWANLGVAAEDYLAYVRSGRLPDPLTKDAAIDLVRTLLATGGGDERTVSWWLEGLARRTGCLHISEMIYWPAGRSWAAEEIIDHAWSCTPIAL